MMINFLNEILQSRRPNRTFNGLERDNTTSVFGNDTN